MMIKQIMLTMCRLECLPDIDVQSEITGDVDDNTDDVDNVQVRMLTCVF